MSGFQILSLSGGGYGGLYTAAVLQELESRCKKPVGRCFDLIAGTSIGGIIALAVGFEIPMERVVAAFETEGQNIFPERGASWLQRRFNSIQDYQKPFYSLKTLRRVVSELLTNEPKLGESLHPLLIPSVNVTKGQPTVFKTRHHKDYQSDYLKSAIDIALATAAAPTFYPPAKIDSCLYVDGGLVATSPDLVAMHEATYFLKQKTEDLKMISIGTTSANYSIVDDDKNSYGAGFWVVDGEHRLPNAFLSSQQQVTVQIVAHTLGERYIRIDTVPSAEQARHLGLAKASATAQATLLGLGEQSAKEALGKPFVQEILKHTAGNWLLKG